MEGAAADARRRQLAELAPVVEDIDRIAREVAALHERGARAELHERPCGSAHLGSVAHRLEKRRILQFETQRAARQSSDVEMRDRTRRGRAALQ